MNEGEKIESLSQLRWPAVQVINQTEILFVCETAKSLYTINGTYPFIPDLPVILLDYLYLYQTQT